MNTLLIIIGLIYAYYLVYRQASALVWLISVSIFSAFWLEYVQAGWASITLLSTLFALSLLLAFKPLRRMLFSKLIFKQIAKAMPKMSSTEREALEAGTVSWEGDIFSGDPDFRQLCNTPVVNLTDKEQAFMNGPLLELCRMIDDWQITHELADMPEEMWTFIRKNKFLGMIIPEEFGGLGFSASAQMMILVKLYGRSVTVATSVSVPNSLGPGELLLKYGTEEQKNHYLPRLANGEEIPCFALTGPNAGSDAASIPDTGVVCKKTIDGKEVVGIKLNWDKRYITLAPVATVIGLAFRLFDPDEILGKGKDIGISCALIPAHTKGVVSGRRHFPLNTAFLNGPTQGKDVFIRLDDLIGGAELAGHGWRMLMECLSAGRAISLPSSASGGAQFAAMTSGAYSRVRRQFNQPIARFEGIEEPLARIAANTYIIDAGLSMATAAIDQGAKPSVVGAILKYHCTERSRQVALDAMDIHGGKGICLGPNNYIGRGYQSAPIGITVEGANILTRSLIIFGQGAIRCHPYVFKEMEAVRENNIKAFDKAFFGHAALIMSSLSKSILFSFTDARGSKAPASLVKRYYQLAYRYSANLSFMADYCMAVMGASLKRKERISARLGDMLSTLYLVSAVLKRFYEDQEPLEDLPLVQYCCEQLFFECEQAMAELIENIKPRAAAISLKLMVMPFGRRRKKPSDKLAHKLAQMMTEPNKTRDRLTRFVFKEAVEFCPGGQLEQTFLDLTKVADLEKRVIKLLKEGKLTQLEFTGQIKEAEALGALSAEEAQEMLRIEQQRQKMIAVDDFSFEELAHVSLKFGQKNSSQEKKSA